MISVLTNKFLMFSKTTLTEPSLEQWLIWALTSSCRIRRTEIAICTLRAGSIGKVLSISPNMKGLIKSKTRDRNLLLAWKRRIHGFSKYLKFSIFSDSAAQPVLFGKYCLKKKTKGQKFNYIKGKVSHTFIWLSKRSAFWGIITWHDCIVAN